jgi:DNA-3-methyladenine glycosylase II
MTSTDLLAAEQQLCRADKTLARLIRRHRPCTLGTTRRDPFHVLCSSIISQQLSSKAADTIQKRLMQALGARKWLRPGQIIATDHDRLRGCGLSNAKARWLRTLAQQVDSGEFSFARLRRMEDEAAIAALDALPGIGRWTAEMYLIFALDRPDIFAMDDVGLRRAVDQLYGSGTRLDDAATLAITQKWAPYRSVASWYLWRLTDG